jgi:mono/diheme cytochrome c family protein
MRVNSGLPAAGGWRLARVGGFVLLSVALVACRQDMHDAPRYEPLEASSFFTDGSSERMPVANTISRNPLPDGDELLYTGHMNGELSNMFPMPVTATVLARGQERYNIFCAPCHGRTGKGDGMIVQRGMKQPPSFMEDRLRTAPSGYFFDVMTHGFGVMQDYASQIPVQDRWAIVAYERALQFSQHAAVADVPDDRRGDLDRPAAAPAAEAAPRPEAR